MHIHTGQLFSTEDMDGSEKISQEQFDKMREDLVRVDKRDLETLMTMHPEMSKSWMRNKPCPCGSGSKFKKCCWGRKEIRLNVAA